MAYEFKLPDLGEGLTEGEVARWLVEVGQEIAEDDPLVEIATDKTTVEIPSPAAGVVSSILVAAGEVVPVGTILVVIGGDGAADSPAPARPAANVRRAQPRRRRPTRSARRRSCAGSRRSSASTSPPSPASGPQGRVTEQDVRAAAAPSEGRREPLRGVRRLMFEHLTRAHREIPAVTWVEECDFGHVDLEAARAARAQGGRGVLAASSPS